MKFHYSDEIYNKKATHSNRYFSSHAITYAISNAKRDNTGKVLATQCRFCIAFKPEASSKNGKSTGRVFKTFLTDSYTAHHRLVHPLKWAEYCQLAYEDNIKSFDVEKHYGETINAFFWIEI